MLLAGFRAIHSVGESVRRHLQSSFDDDEVGFDCAFDLLSTGQLATYTEPDESAAVTLFLYRVTVNEHLRNTALPGREEVLPDLPLDLHLMLSVWADSAEAEQVMLGWTMRQLHLLPVIDGSTLPATILDDDTWSGDERIQLVHEELATEDIMRIWDAFDVPYRLSTTYVARVVRISPPSVRTPKRVLATRLSAGDSPEPREDLP